MNEKLNRALGNIDESLIFEAANADRAEHNVLRTVRNIALPLAAAAAVAGIAFATKDYWKPIPNGVSLVESDPVTLEPLSQGCFVNRSAHERINMLLSDYGQAEEYLKTESVSGEKVEQTYFASNFPNLICVRNNIAVFTDGVDSAVFFCDIAKDTADSERIVFGVDLEKTVESLDLCYDNLGYRGGGQTNGISVFATENEGETRFYLSAASYEGEDYAFNIYRLVYDTQSGSICLVKDEERVNESFPEYEGILEQAYLDGEPMEIDGGTISTRLDNGWDFAHYCLDISEDSGETRTIYPFAPFGKFEEESGEIPDFSGEDADYAEGWLIDNGYVVSKTYTEDYLIDEDCVIETVSLDGNHAILKISLGMNLYNPFANVLTVINPTWADGGAMIYDKEGQALCGFRQEETGHTGVDIAAQEGTPVYAAASGTVLIAEKRYPYGNYIMISHGNGELKSVYGNCSELYVSAGDTISAGQKIASVGSTGIAQQSALHFELLRNDVPLPHPLDFCTKNPIESEETALMDDGYAVIIEKMENYSADSLPEAESRLCPPLHNLFITAHHGYDEWSGGFHYGIDAISGKEESAPVYAALSGKVVDAHEYSSDGSPDDNAFGGYVILAHSDGLFSFYSHLSNVEVSVGEDIALGDIIGDYGEIGFTAGPHLHFGLWRDGESLDPESFDYLTYKLDSDNFLTDEDSQRVTSETELVCPLTADSGYRVEETTYADGGYYAHAGVDLSAENGTPIYAAADGTVTLSRYYYGYGNCVMIESDSGITTVYAHCGELIAEEGSTVKAGEQIATVGSTGQTTGNSLHFEVRCGDKIHPRPLDCVKIFPEDESAMAALLE